MFSKTEDKILRFQYSRTGHKSFIVTSLFAIALAGIRTGCVFRKGGLQAV